MKNNVRICEICKKSFAQKNVVSAHLVRKPVYDLIASDCPEWSDAHYICRSDLSTFRSKYVHSLIESDKGELSKLEEEVLESLVKHEVISSNLDTEMEGEWSFGERLADRIAAFGGSWPFLIIFAVFLVIWIGVNSTALLWHPADPYPFILLNLILSCLASVQAPIIIMSQNRQGVKDRLRAQHDYQVNLKAELEIRQIHEKLDHLLSKQWERLVQIQEIQVEQLSEISELKQGRKKGKP